MASASSRLSRERVAAIAALAHLELDVAELDLFARQLTDILAYAEDIQQVDTSGVPPTAGVGAGRDADRADQVAASLPLDDVLANAPESSPPFFRVPRVIG